MKNIEIELRVKVLQVDGLLSWLQSKGRLLSTEHQKDIYYSPTEGSFLYVDSNGEMQADKWLRIRASEKQSSICYKFVHRDRDGLFRYADEYETEVEQPNIMHEILSSLGYSELCTVSKERTSWQYNNYMIFIDRVDALGDFVEIELLNANEDSNIDLIKVNMLQFLVDKSGSELEKIEGGYPWLLMQNTHKF